MKVLFVEPLCRSKYPPVGLMKIATSHRLAGDDVFFVRGTKSNVRALGWDRIYITTLFTYHWKKAVETIRFYQRDGAPVLVGGILATLMPDELHAATGVEPHVGPYRGEAMLLERLVCHDKDLVSIVDYVRKWGVDALPPDYGLIGSANVPYRTMLDSSYIVRSTRGCTRHCPFCAVDRIAPEFLPAIPLTQIVRYIASRWGERCNLLLLDDNFLLSPEKEGIVDEIRSLGFAPGARLAGKLRHVDFNQGLDVRLLTRQTLEVLSSIALSPLRLAFDDIALGDILEERLQWAVEVGFREISVYVLYNYMDSPIDLYRRLRRISNLNLRFRCRIYSFPMKYIPNDAKDRQHIGPRWTRRQIRTVQCILSACHGIVPTQPEFFRVAFGRSTREFLAILQMPENYVISRSAHMQNGAIRQWQESFNSLTPLERRYAKRLISGGKGSISSLNSPSSIDGFLGHYREESNGRSPLPI